MDFFKRLFFIEDPKEFVIEKITQVASKINLREKFEDSAQEAAYEMDESYLEIVASFIDNPPKMPKESSYKFAKPEEWSAACNSAAFEILYNFDEKAVPLFKDIAFNASGAHQKMALYFLLRLAKEDVNTNEVLEDIVQNTGLLSEESVLYTALCLSKFKDDNNGYKALDRIFDYWHNKNAVLAYSIFKHIVICKKEAAFRYLFFLKRLAKGKGLENIKELNDPTRFFVLVNEMEERMSDGKTVLGYYFSVEAAQCFYFLAPDDEEIQSLLFQWAENHEDLWIREHLKQLMENTADWREGKLMPGADENTFVPLRKSRVFKTLKVDKYGRENNRLAYDRKYCSPAKLFEQFAEDLKEHFEVRCEIEMKSELNLCKSCEYVKKQFDERYPGVKIDLEILSPSKEAAPQNISEAALKIPAGHKQYEISLPLEYIKVVLNEVGGLTEIPIDYQMVEQAVENNGEAGKKCVCTFRKSEEDGSFIALDCWYNDTINTLVVRCKDEIQDKVKLALLKWDSLCRRDYHQNIFEDLEDLKDVSQSALINIAKIHGVSIL
ncbi:MAG: hypothetical protein N2645_04545 [Clostridia bacterium]|nr:hypothetical protein [Clostridia bacterium]